jgi:hypothetical protein
MSHKPASTDSKRSPAEQVVGLYRRAFAEYGARALWNITEYEDPTIEQVLAITRQLRTEGDVKARRLAEEIEQAARAYRECGGPDGRRFRSDASAEPGEFLPVVECKSSTARQR